MIISAQFAPIISPAIDGFALVITILSGYYMYRQKTTSYQSVRTTLLAVYMLASVLVLLEVFRISIIRIGSAETSLLMTVYTELSTSLVLLCAFLLGLAALATYLRPVGKDYMAMFLDVFKNDTLHGTIFLGYSLLISFSAVYLWLFHPFVIQPASNLWGVTLLSTNFTFNYLLLLLAILLFFLAYPTPLLILAARKVSNRAIRRSLVILATCWAGIGLDFVIFDGFLWTMGIDANDLMYLVFSSVFSITAVIFRKASTLAGFFDSKHDGRETQVPVSYPFSKRLGVDNDFLEGRSFLVEVDPSASYESTVRDFALEFISLKRIVFVFTAKGSPIYKILARNQDVKFYILSTDVSYPKPTDQPNEILAPQNDQAVLLDLLNKTVNSTTGTGIGLIFDNISDMILSSSFENTYKFVRQANEIVNEPRITSLFLITLGAHDEKIVRIIKSLFANHLVDETAGLKITRRV